jgi:RsbT co-antagonist protein rsbRD N-terminal domain
MQPSIDSLLTKQKAAIVDGWLQTILKTYPEQTQKFLVKQRDSIANPVGQTFAREFEPLLEALLASPEVDRAAVELHLDPIVRIRAVQEFSPSEALGFVFELKHVIRAVLGDDAGPVLAVIDQRIDWLVLIAFEVYLGCVKQMYEIRVDEMRRRTGKLLERMNRGESAPKGRTQESNE